MSNTAAGPDTRPTPTVNVGRLLGAVLGSVLVLPISVAGVAVALPAIARDLGSDPTQLQWVVNGFNVAFAVSTLVWAGFADRVGLKRTFVINTIVMSIGSLASATASTLLALDIARVVAGAGAGAIQVSAAAIISTSLRGRARARAFGLLGTMLGTGLALGPTITGAVTSAFGWRSAFLIPLLPFAVALALSRYIPSVRSRQAAAAPNRNPADTRKRLDLGILRNKRFVAISLVPVVQAVGFISLLTYLPTALGAVWAMSEGTAGIAMLTMTIPVLALPTFAVRAVAQQRMSAFTVIYAGLACMTAGNLLLVVAVRPDMPFWMAFVPMVLLGASFGLPLGLLDGEALAVAEPSREGQAAGLLNFLRIGAEAIAVGAYGIVLAQLIGSRIDDPDIAARVSAGDPAQPEVYAAAFHVVQVGIIGLTIMLTAIIAVTHRSSTRAHMS